MLIKSWYIDHLAIGHNMMTTRVVQSAAAALQPPSITVRHAPAPPTPPAKRQRNDKPSGKGKGKDVPVYNKNVLAKITDEPMSYKKLPDTLKAFIRANLNVTQANKALRDAMQRKDDLFAVFKHFCRNCWVAGRGWVVHALSVCRQSGNSCSLDCPKCGSGHYHWAEQCPKNS